MNSVDRYFAPDWVVPGAPDQSCPGYVARVVRFSDGSCEVTARQISTREAQLMTRDPFAALRVRPELSEEEEVERAAAKAEENRLRSAKRAAQRCRHAVKEIGCDRLLTLTTRECITDRDVFLGLVARFQRAIRHRQGKMFPYVGALELQKRGAWHLHLAVAGYKEVGALTRLWWEILGARGAGTVNIRGPKPGFRYSAWSRARLASYLSKYVAKDMGADGGLLAGRQRLLRSKGVSAVDTRFYFPGSRYADFSAFVCDLARDFGVEGTMFFRDNEVAWWCSPAASG